MKIYWTTNLGTKLLIEDMSPNHQSNTIAMLRNKMGDTKILKAMLLGLKQLQEEELTEEQKLAYYHHVELNGEMAQASVDAYLDSAMEDEYGVDGCDLWF